MRNKKLYRNTNNRQVCGVCAGIGDFLGLDPTIIRVIYALVTLFTGTFPGVVIYFILALIIPEDNGMIDTDVTENDDE